MFGLLGINGSSIRLALDIEQEVQVDLSSILIRDSGDSGVEGLTQSANSNNE